MYAHNPLLDMSLQFSQQKNYQPNEGTFVSFSICIGEKETEPSSVIVDYSQLLGSGNYGNVYLGLFNSHQVAVKMLRGKWYVQIMRIIGFENS